MPKGAIYVGRPTAWGNPFAIGDSINAPDGTVSVCFSRGQAVESYRGLIEAFPHFITRAQAELRGKDLACWCPLDEPCHADVLLEIANA